MEPTESRPSIVAIVGPTGVGKSALALALARRFAVEIVSADSRQVYRGLDVGTAKPTHAEQVLVPHHLIDVVDPEDDFSLAEFQDRAYLAIEQIQSRGRIPLIVGGTGLYVRAVADGTLLPRVAPNESLRRDLEAEARHNGTEALHRRLAAIDPVAAERIDGRNIRRVIRALEVIAATGQPFSAAAASTPRYEVLWLGVTTNRSSLYDRIDRRVVDMLRDGMIEETAKVLARGCWPDRPALRGLGYRQVVQYHHAEIDLDLVRERYQFESHRYVRQQYNWFRLTDPRIHWLEPVPDHVDRAANLIESFRSRASSQRLEARS